MASSSDLLFLPLLIVVCVVGGGGDGDGVGIFAATVTAKFASCVNKIS